jgi:hypothetical protein
MQVSGAMLAKLWSWICQGTLTCGSFYASARVIPLQVKMVFELHQSFIHVPDKLFANARHQYLHPFHQVVVQPDIMPRWSHGRLATTSSGSRTLIIQRDSFRSKVGTITHTCCFEIVHTLRPDQEAIHWLLHPRRLSSTQRASSVSHFPSTRAVAKPVTSTKIRQQSRNGKAPHVISYCRRVESGVLTRVASRPIQTQYIALAIRCRLHRVRTYGMIKRPI